MKLILSVMLFFLLVACSPSESVIQTAIAQTQEANPSATITPFPLSLTSTNTPTNTQTIAPSPTPDLLVLPISLKDFLLQQSDLPPNAEYWLQKDNYLVPDPAPIPNDSNQIIKEGVYLAETGRIDGWLVWYLTDFDDSFPRRIDDNVILYETMEGAQLSITKFSDDLVAEYGFPKEINPPEIGDLTRSFMIKEPVVTSPGQFHYQYRILFSFKNIVHVVEGLGGNVKPEFVRSVAHNLLSRLQESPFVNP